MPRAAAARHGDLPGRFEAARPLLVIQEHAGPPQVRDSQEDGAGQSGGLVGGGAGPAAWAGLSSTLVRSTGRPDAASRTDSTVAAPEAGTRRVAGARPRADGPP